MPLLSLELDTASPDSAPAQLPFSSHSLRLTYDTNRRWFPRRGFLLSLLVHEIAIVALLYVPPPTPSRPRVWREREWEVTMLPKDVLYLPEIGGGSKGGNGGPGSKPTVLPAAAAGSGGMTYAGRQAIVSNPPNPTNHIQTVLHPDLPAPPPLKEFVPLPNMMTLAQPPPAPPLPKPAEPPSATPKAPPLPRAPVIPKVTLDGPQPVEAPKLTLPATPPPAASADLLQAQVPAPPPPPQEAPKAQPPPPAPQTPPAPEPTGVHNLLVLSATPAPPNPAAKVPEGEARGQFAISPQANPQQWVTGIANGPGSEAAATPGTGASPGPAEGSKVTGAGSLGNSVYANGKAGAGEGKEGAGGGLGGRGGLGDGVGPGAGSGSGAGHGPGKGAGAGPGPGPFAGMTIQGAESPAGAIAIPSPSNSSPSNQAPNAYGMTIISTGNSGGGVGDFGIFHDEAVFTVYLNPAEGKDDPSPPWPLQYAALDPAGGGLRDLLPPFASKKQTPVWPADLLTRYKGQQIVVFGIINTEGKMEHLIVLQSPDARLSDVLLAALRQWLFRPANLNGEPVPLKAVLGVPIS